MSRIAVIGAGAVGCYYGARLAEAGHEVHFLLRSAYDAVAASGLHIESVDGHVDLEDPAIARSSAEIGSVDWVLCALKATAMDEARDLVAPCVGPETRILALMNGLGIEEQFAAWFPDTPIFGGLAFTCINRGEPGRIHHIDYGPVTIGHLGDDDAELARALELWRDAKVQVPTAPSLLAARWQKLCWNVPFNGLTVTGGGITTDIVMNDPELRASAAGLMRELVAAGNADLQAHAIDARLDADEVVDSMMTRTETMAAYRPSTMIDFLEGREMELDAIFEAPLRRASELGVDTPLLAMITAQMRVLGTPRSGSAAYTFRARYSAQINSDSNERTPVAELLERPPRGPEDPSGNPLWRFKRSPLGQTLASRSFRFYWTSTFFYFLVFGTQRFTFIWLVLELSDNAALAGVTAFALGIPAFFITLPAGAYADRLDRKQMVLWTNVAGALISIAIAALIWTDVITVTLAIVMALATGVTTAATQPPLTAMIPTIVPRERLMNGIVLRTMGQNLAMVLGATLGGVVIDVWNIGGAFAILTVAYGLSTLAMLGVHSQPMPQLPNAGPRPSLRTSVGEGLTFIYRNPGLLGLMVLLATMGFVMLGPVFVLVPEIAREDLGQGATGAGILFAITSVGMLAMSIALASMSNLRRKGALLLITLMIGGVTVIGIGASQWYLLTAVVMFLWGLGGGIMVNLNQTLAQSHTPNEMMGRVMSVVALAIAGMMPLGSLAAGGGAELIGAGEWLMVCGVALIVIGAVLWVRLPALREMD